MPRRVARPRGQAQALAAGAAVLLVLMMVFLIIRSPSPPGTGGILSMALERLQQEESFRVVILEEAAGESLFFQGRMEGGVLTGELPEYDLEVSYGEELLLRRSGEEEWQAAEAMNLQGLAGFLFSPVEILGLQKANFTEAFAGTDITLSNRLHKTIFLELDPNDRLIGELFPEIDSGIIETAKLGVALAEPDLEIKQLRIILKFTGKAGELERTYYLGE